MGFSIFQVMSVLYTIVNAITTGTELTKSLHFGIGTQSFNVNVEGALLPKNQQPPLTTGAKSSGITTSNEATAEVTHETPAMLMSALLGDIAKLEFSPIGTPVVIDYSYLIADSEYVNATITLMRVS